MTLYNFEGDISGISDRQLEFINTVLVEKGLRNEETKVLFEPLGKSGDNYQSIIKRITLEGTTGKVSLIAKIAPTNNLIRMIANTYIAFNNEHIIYMEVLPKFTQLENAVNIPENHRLRYAKCYGTFCEQPNEVILLEDLSISNFNVLDRFEPLSDICMKSFLKNFAKFHSLSYVFKKNEPVAYDFIKSKLIDVWSVAATMAEFKIFFQQLENEVMSVLDNEEHKNLVRHKISELANTYVEVTKDDLGSKHSVIQQGDAWTNNIMFRMEGDAEVESIMIDYQQSKESNPAADLLYMIFNCTDHETRTKHFNDWIEYYHMELYQCLSNFGLNDKCLYPKDQLEADLKRYGNLMFGVCLTFANNLARKSKDALNIMNATEATTIDLAQMVESSNISSLDDETNKRFRDRINGLIMSFTEFGLLSNI